MFVKSTALSPSRGSSSPNTLLGSNTEWIVWMTILAARCFRSPA